MKIYLFPNKRCIFFLLDDIFMMVVQEYKVKIGTPNDENLPFS